MATTTPLQAAVFGRTPITHEPVSDCVQADAELPCDVPATASIAVAAHRTSVSRERPKHRNAPAQRRI